MGDMQRASRPSTDDKKRNSDEARNDDRRGEDDGYNQQGRGGYGQNAGTELQRQAQQNGYTDGVYYAQKDMQSGRNNNPQNTQGYKDADRSEERRVGKECRAR